MTAEERRKKKEEEKAKVEEKKKVEEAILVVEEKKKIEETNTAAAQVSEEPKKGEARENEKVDETGVEEIPPSPVQQITLPYMKRREEGAEVENPGVEVEEAFSYFSNTTTILASSTTSTVVDSETRKNLATYEEPSAASVVLEARAIVAAVIGEASFISSFDSSRSKSLEEEEEDGDDDPLGEERNFSAVNREMLGSDSEVNDEESDGLGLLEEIKEEIVKEEEKVEVESNPSFSKKSSYQRPGTWTNITITSNLLQNSEEPLSPAEDKVKLLELRMMMEEMERMVGLLEEEMRDLQMRVEMDWMSLVTLASLVTSPLAGVRPGG